MKKLKKSVIFFSVLCFLSGMSGCSQNGASLRDEETEYRFLLIGNSLTYYNDLHEQVRNICADAAGIRLAVDESAAPGVGLVHHASPEYSETLAMIGSNAYTAVVIQGKSDEPLTGYESFRKNAKILSLAAEEHGARVFFFETWAPHEDGSSTRQLKTYDQEWTGGSRANMQKLILSACERTAGECGGTVIPAGQVWEMFTREYPEIRLYTDDGSHPSLHGTYLTACVIARALTGADPQAAGWRPEGISRREARILRRAAEWSQL